MKFCYSNKLQSEREKRVLIIKIKNVRLLYLGANDANIIFYENIMNEFVK